MIARIWHGVTPSVGADEYFNYLNRTGISDYRATAGNKGVLVLRRLDEGKTHFLLISLWESLAAVQQFAGTEIEKAQYYPEDENYLLELEPQVQHYEILTAPSEAKCDVRS
ncbi:MAG: antibiotic biosynthesis monooxygenase [Pyrinomonadaceae bacterium]